MDGQTAATNHQFFHAITMGRPILLLLRPCTRWITSPSEMPGQSSVERMRASMLGAPSETTTPNFTFFEFLQLRLLPGIAPASVDSPGRLGPRACSISSLVRGLNLIPKDQESKRSALGINLHPPRNKKVSGGSFRRVLGPGVGRDGPGMVQLVF